MTPTGTVKMNLPPELAGNNPGELLKSMGLVAHQLSSETWEIQAAAGLDLVHFQTLATPWNKDRKFDLLKMFPSGLPPKRAALYKKTQERLAEKMEKGSLVAHLNLIQVDVTSAQDDKIAAIADHYDAQIGKLPGDNGPRYPNHTTHVINLSELVYRRAKLAQILMRLDQDPQFRTDLANQDQSALPLGELFHSNDVLLQSLRIGDMYVAPLLGCCSPGVWAINGQRMFGSVIFSLGRVVMGLDLTAAELLQLLPHTLTQPAPSEDPPTLHKRSFTEAVEWWGHRLNQMFQYLSDPTLFADHNGEYLPYLQQNWMMTVEQTFRRIASTNTSDRDPNAQLVLMFNAMGVFTDRITGDGIKLYKPSRARQALQTAKDGMPKRVAELMLPKAERALAALESLQDGFFIKAQRGTSDVKLVNDAGAVEPWDMETASAKLLQARRNAIHGFGGLAPVAGDPVRILAQHDGHIPRDLADLPYLYLLEFLCLPERAANTIRGSAAEWNKPATA